jgi:hypothetical protein
MLAARRFRFLLVVFTLTTVLSVPLLAQSPYMEFHGVPASGIGGTSAAFSAVRPNANPNAGAAYLGCCASFFFPSSFSPMVPYPSLGTERRTHRRHHHRDHDVAGVVAEPVYIPYAVPYAVDSEEDAADDDQSGVAAREPGRAGSYATGVNGGRRQVVANGKPVIAGETAGGNAEADSSYDAGADSVADAAPERPTEPPEPVVAQPTTVLVFKDGHRADVVNYAIVGDTLFDFSGDRAHKIAIADLDIAATQRANDAAGVEFKLPPAGGVN